MSPNQPVDAKASGKPRHFFLYGAFGFSVMLHVFLLVVIGGVVLIEQTIPQAPFRGLFLDSENDNDQVVAEEEMVPEERSVPEDLPASDAVGGSSGLAGETSPITDVLTTESHNTPFFAAPMANPGLSMMPGPGTGQSGAGGGGSGNGRGTTGRITIFGGDQKTPGAMEAMFYDTKQSRSGKTTADTSKYSEVVLDFVVSGFKPEKLSRYFQSGPLYPTRMAISFTSSSEAVKAFDVVGKAEPTQWIVHYHGKITAPKTASYRFAGYGDDFLYVALDGKLVLDGCHELLKGNPSRLGKGKDPNTEVVTGWMAYGKWVDLVQGQSYEFDVAIGDYGASFGVVLFVEEKGVSYGRDGGGHPVLPLFRTDDQRMEKVGRYVVNPEGPVFSP